MSPRACIIAFVTALIAIYAWIAFESRDSYSTPNRLRKDIVRYFKNPKYYPTQQEPDQDSGTEALHDDPLSMFIGNPSGLGNHAGEYRPEFRGYGPAGGDETESSAGAAGAAGMPAGDGTNPGLAANGGGGAAQAPGGGRSGASLAAGVGNAGEAASGGGAAGVAGASQSTNSTPAGMVGGGGGGGGRAANSSETGMVGGGGGGGGMFGAGSGGGR